MAKGNPVKCLYCGESFYKSDCEWVKPTGNRYAHKECAEKEENKKTIILQIHEKMKSKLGDSYNRAKIDKQIKQYVKDGKTEIGILKSVEYWYDVKGSSTDQAAGGIGIIPYIYDEAKRYYERQKKYAEMRLNVDPHDYITDTKTFHVRPKPIRRPIGVKLFDLA